MNVQAFLEWLEDDDSLFHLSKSAIPYSHEEFYDQFYNDGLADAQQAILEKFKEMMDE